MRYASIAAGFDDRPYPRTSIARAVAGRRERRELMAVRVPRLWKAVHEQDQRALSFDYAVHTNAVDVVDLMVLKGRFADHRSSLSCTGVAARRLAGRFAAMSKTNDYVPSAWEWVRDQVDAYERSGGKEANTLRDTGLPVIIVTTRGREEREPCGRWPS